VKRARAWRHRDGRTHFTAADSAAAGRDVLPHTSESLWTYAHAGLDRQLKGESFDNDHS
jgi:hypothetical protein